MEEFKDATITGHFEFVVKKPQAGKSRDYRDVIVFEKLRFQMFSVHTKMQSRRFKIPPV